MCLGIPMKIVEIKNSSTAVAETMGIRRTVRLEMVPEAAVGDHVLVHAGFAIQVIDTEEVLERMHYLEKMLIALEEEK